MNHFGRDYIRICMVIRMWTRFDCCFVFLWLFFCCSSSNDGIPYRSRTRITCKCGLANTHIIHTFLPSSFWHTHTGVSMAVSPSVLVLLCTGVDINLRYNYNNYKTSIITFRNTRVNRWKYAATITLEYIQTISWMFFQLCSHGLITRQYIT